MRREVGEAAPLLDRLVARLQILPGVGPKSAQRMALFLLTRRRQEGVQLAELLKEALQQIGSCDCCRNFSQTVRCSLCQDDQRDATRLCIVETPHDLLAIEALRQYQGRYFVLLGRLSPIEGVFPEHLGLPLLEKHLKEGGVEEVILATNPTVEGEMTAQFIASLAEKYGVISTRLAHGVPMGSELEHLDRLTLNHAFLGRKPMRER